MAAEIRLGSLNYVALMGRACADPDLKYTPKGTPVLNFRMAVSRRYKDNGTGEWKSSSSFSRNEIPLAIYCLQKAFEKMVGESSGESDSNGTEEVIA